MKCHEYCTELARQGSLPAWGAWIEILHMVLILGIRKFRQRKEIGMGSVIDKVIQEDPNLLMYYDISSGRI